jgi:ribokinase
VVVGAINLDLVVPVPRLPRAGETVVGARLERHGGGKGANSAVAAARAGARVRLVGAVGADENGARAVAELRSVGINTEGIAVLDGDVSGVALIVVDPHGENQVAVAAGANMSLTVGHVRATLASVLALAGCVLVSTEIPGAAVAVAVEMAAAAGVPCVVNPAPVIAELAEVLKHGPVLTPNATESLDLLAVLGTGLRAAVGAGGTEVTSAGQSDLVGSHADAARRIAERTGAPVVVTLGGDGALVLAADGQLDHVPARPTIARDTTGAGDTFNGVLATRIAAGDEFAAAVRTAMVAASLSVAAFGARSGMPKVPAIEVALREMQIDNGRLQ